MPEDAGGTFAIRPYETIILSCDHQSLNYVTQWRKRCVADHVETPRFFVYDVTLQLCSQHSPPRLHGANVHIIHLDCIYKIDSLHDANHGICVSNPAASVTVLCVSALRARYTLSCSMEILVPAMCIRLAVSIAEARQTGCSYHE